MKNIFKAILSFLIIFTLLTTVLCFNASAASVSVSGGEFNVGESVKIKVSFAADSNIYAVEADASYNSSVLRLDSVSGADYTTGNGTIKIVDDNFSAGGASSSSYTLNFTAIAAGNSDIAVNVTGAGESVSSASGAAAVSVVTPKPSSNADLSSLTISGVSLSPAFKASTTAYSATVKYSVENVNVKGSVADGGATYVGGGSWGLKVGDNSRTITVTAADGTKKSYTINIKRMTEEETANAEQEERDANPTLVVINNVDYTIVNDLSIITIPAGFTQGTATRKDTELAVLNDDNGEYQLFYLTDMAGENGAFYTRDENDVFKRLNCISAYGKLFIIEDPDFEGKIPEGYVKANRNIDGADVEVFNFTAEELKDFYIVKCYVGGTRAYYCFDSAEGILQRALQFDLAVKEANTVKVEEHTGKMAWFTKMTKTGKIVFFIIVFAAAMLIAVSVILIVKIASSSNTRLDDDYIDENKDFILNDFVEEEEAVVDTEE